MNGEPPGAERPTPPAEVDGVDRRLRRVRFEPRASFGPELLGRIRRGEPPAPARLRALRRWRLQLLVAGVAAAIAVLMFSPKSPVTIDRCCYDLDGGGKADDGVRVLAQRDGRVYRLSIYEDLDGSRSSTPADIVRLDRTGRPVLEEVTPPGLSTIRRCCQDLDGGGPADDGIVVVGLPPDRVVSAAIYELR